MMKYSVLMIFFCNVLMSQTNDHTGVRIEYEMNTMFSDYRAYDAVLELTDSSSYFVYFPVRDESNGVKVDDSGGYSINLIDSTKQSVYIVDRLDSVVEVISISKSNVYCVNSYLETPEWEILDSTKMIGDYVVSLATCDYAGRKYFAWFTPQLKYSKGPWKLHGLPGLIIEAYDSERVVYFQVKKISQSAEISTVDQCGDPISKEKFKEELDAFSERFKSMLQSRFSSKNFTVTVDKTETTLIEVYD